MTPRLRPDPATPLAEDPASSGTPSFLLSGIGVAVLGIGAVGVACGLAGLTDDASDSGWLVGSGMVCLLVGSWLGRRFVRPRRASPNRILTGLGLIWLAVTLIGAVVYLLTGAIERVDDALLESASGFTATNLTTVDPEELSRALVLWRAGTQWIGGMMGIVLSVVALPEALRGTALSKRHGNRGPLDLVPNAIRGRRRILGIYTGFTAAVLLGYLATGLGATEAVAHAMTTVSTGGFSTNADSFVGYGTGPRIVAGMGMLVAGSSIFVLWWIVRGQLQPLWRSTELRTYVAIVALTSVVIVIDVGDVSVGEAMFTAVSIVSTTGFAAGDWTAWGDDVAGLLLVVAAIGAMLGSAGGGFKVIRAQLLVRFAMREMRRQLDPNSVVVVKHRDRALDERTIDQIAGYQISHMTLCGLGALLLAVLGTSVLGGVWGATSAVSTLGPAVGEIGSFGSVEALTGTARLVLVGLMVAGRLSIVPALVILVWGLQGERLLWRRIRFFGTTANRSLGRGRSHG